MCQCSAVSSPPSPTPELATRLCLAQKLSLGGAGNCGMRLPAVPSPTEGDATKRFRREFAAQAGLSQHRAAAGRVMPSSKHEREGDSLASALGTAAPSRLGQLPRFPRELPLGAPGGERVALLCCAAGGPQPAPCMPPGWAEHPCPALAWLGGPCLPRGMAPGAAAMGCVGSHIPLGTHGAGKVPPRAACKVLQLAPLAPQPWAPMAPQTTPQAPAWGAWTPHAEGLVCPAEDAQHPARLRLRLR